MRQKGRSFMKKLISILLAFIIALSTSITVCAAETTKNKYPIIFVHGMFGWGNNEGINKIAPYWGGTNGSLVKYLRDNNIDCFDVSVGPISSAWDNACELYAQLTGTRVDYGEAHSKEHGHNRYGRTYDEPLFEGWGKNKKIHLIGHSHGGQAVRMLAHLMAHGNKAEVDSTDKESVSPLFTGGKEDFIHSVTTICSPNNGTAAYEFGTKMLWRPILRGVSYTYAAILGRSFLNGIFADFHLEQFGITDIPGETPNRNNLFTALNNLATSGDDVVCDLSFEGAEKTNKMLVTNENIYYFCYAYDATSEKYNLPVETDFFMLALTAMMLSLYGVPESDCNFNFDKSWLANDGLVNTVSAQNPMDEPAKNFDGKAEIGLWNVMPVIKGDHGTPIGLFSDEGEFHKFYDNLTAILISTEK